MKAVAAIATIGLGLLCSMTITATAVPATNALTYRVTLTATITKNWNTTITEMVDGCQQTTHSVGARTITVRSMRPTRVLVRHPGGRVSFSPRVVRFLTVSARPSGGATVERKFGADCSQRDVRTSECPRNRSVSGGQAARFVRLKRNELSFARTGWPAPGVAQCSSEPSQVRAIRPGLHQASGEISEADLGNPRRGAQSGYGFFEQTTTLDEGSLTGTVVERVTWTLKFKPA